MPQPGMVVRTHELAWRTDDPTVGRE